MDLHRLPLAFSVLAATAFTLSVAPAAVAQDPPPVTFTADQDHQNMMDQLGIKALRPGPSGDEKAPNHANYDESKANQYPTIPALLVLKNGQKVTTAAAWWKQRRPEIAEDFEREVYGRIPKNVPKVNWKVKVPDREFIGFTPVIAKDLEGVVDNSAYPAIEVKIAMTVVVPANAKGPVPVLMMFGRTGLPSPAQPPPEEMERINAALKALLVEKDPSLAAIFAQFPGYIPVTPLVSPYAFRRAASGGRSAGLAAVDCRRLGRCHDQSSQHSGR